MLRLAFHGLVCISLLVIFLTDVARAESTADSATKENTVRAALSAVHFIFEPETFLPRLEKAVGGKDNLIDILLKFRLHPTAPTLPIRSEQVLIEYAAEPRVESALIEDYRHPGRKGLAKVIELNKNRLPAGIREKLRLEN